MCSQFFRSHVLRDFLAPLVFCTPLLQFLTPALQNQQPSYLLILLLAYTTCFPTVRSVPVSTWIHIYISLLLLLYTLRIQRTQQTLTGTPLASRILLWIKVRLSLCKILPPRQRPSFTSHTKPIILAPDQGNHDTQAASRPGPIKLASDQRITGNRLTVSRLLRFLIECSNNS